MTIWTYCKGYVDIIFIFQERLSYIGPEEFVQAFVQKDPLDNDKVTVPSYLRSARSSKNTFNANVMSFAHYSKYPTLQINTPNVYVNSRVQHGVTFFTQRSQHIPRLIYHCPSFPRHVPHSVLLWPKPSNWFLTITRQKFA